MSYILNGENWSFSDPLGIPSLFLEHIYITVVTLVLGLVIAFPLALLVVRYRKLYLPTLTTASLLYTLPSIAVVALLIPLTGLSVATIIIPLVAYAQVVLIRNIVAALRAVDPALIDVGRAMGMNSWQLQLRVVLPQALPIIIAGIRVTTVTTIGIATIGPLVGVQDLGYLIFQGFNASYTAQVAAGAILVSILAIVADLLLLALQRALNRGRTATVAA